MNLDKLISNHRTHYIKLHLNEDWSLRYHFIYEDKQEKEHLWILKSHSLKIEIELKETEANEYANKYKPKAEEIIGFIDIFDKKYKKIFINNNGIDSKVE
jgi:hypothetical protein